MDYEKVIQNNLEKIINKSSKHINLPKEKIKSEVFRAFEFAKNAHEGQNRLSGEPYITHPVEATLILLDLKPDLYTIQACLLHDVIEDTDFEKEDIEKEFGEEVAFLCEGLAKLSKVRYKGEERSVGSLRKMLIAMAEDLRVIFIKLSDRLHNMKTLQFNPSEEKRHRIASETLNIYVPIADRLGLFQMKNNLEEQCFRILDSSAYASLVLEMAKVSDNIDDFLKNTKKEIEILLKKNGVKKFEIGHRVKSIYSIHKKMNRKGLETPSMLYDLFGVKILVDSISDCYNVLGIIHSEYSPVPNRFKDYIALPKPNGYKSLHTTVVGFLPKSRKMPTEFQIKTFEMDEYADIGVAAHFEYKEKGSKIAEDIDWVKDLKDLTENIGNNDDLISSLKIDVFKDRIFVFTPKGDPINLPAGSTPVDFAYAIHSDLGDTIAFVKVNGKGCPIDSELKNGDYVEITTDKSRHPSPFWLSFVKTSKAKDNVRAFLNKEDKEEHRERGKEIFDKYLQKMGENTLDKEISLFKILDGKENNLEERFRILEQIGTFSLNPAALFKKIFGREKSKEILSKLYAKVSSKTSSEISAKDGNEEEKTSLNAKENQIIIGGEEDFEYKKCNLCFKKHFPDRIVAHINSKFEITVHSVNCGILHSINKDRLIPASYKGVNQSAITLKVFITLMNKVGLLKDISEIIFAMGMNIEEIHSSKKGPNSTFVDLTVSSDSNDYFISERLKERLKYGLEGSILDLEVKEI